MKCADLLKEVAKLVGGDRNDQHGDKHDNFANIARLWTSFMRAKSVDVTISAEDVALMMVLLKVARTKTGCYNKDDYADMVGYGSIAYELADNAQGDKADDSDILNPFKPSLDLSKFVMPRGASDALRGLPAEVVEEMKIDEDNEIRDELDREDEDL